VFTNLGPGTYRFRVIASNSESVWNSAETALPFTIAPAWWQMGSFWAAIGLLVAGGIWGGYRMRLRQLARQLHLRFEERLAERSRIARELHDTLLQSFQGALLRFRAVTYMLPDRPAEARATLELAKTAVQLDPVDSRAHLCCGWSYMMALRESEAAPHMQLACELNDNDPWTLLSSAHYDAFCGSIEQARLRAEQSLSLSPAPSYLEWSYHCIIRFLTGDYAGALEAYDRAHQVVPILPAWRAAALFYLGERQTAQEEAQRLVNGLRSFWVGQSAPTDEVIARWVLQAHPISVGERWNALRHGLRGAGLPVDGVVQLSA